MKLITWARGKKTYIVVAVGVILGTIDALHDYGLTTFVVPGYVMFGLTFLGLGTLRAGVEKGTESAVGSAVSMALQVLSAIRAPDAPPSFAPVSPAPTAEDVTSSRNAASQLVKQVAQSPGYAAASEQQKTELLNESQINKG